MSLCQLNELKCLQDLFPIFVFFVNELLVAMTDDSRHDFGRSVCIYDLTRYIPCPGTGESR